MKSLEIVKNPLQAVELEPLNEKLLSIPSCALYLVSVERKCNLHQGQGRVMFTETIMYNDRETLC